MVTVRSSAPQSESCALACICGWSDTLAVGFRRTLVQTRAAALNRGREHLRGAHGAASSLERRLPGNVRELSGINERLLNKDHLKRYRELMASANFRGSLGNSKPMFRMRFRDSKKTMMALAAWLVVWIPLIALMVDATNQVPNSDNAGVVILLLLGSLAVGTVTTFMVLFRETEEWRKRLISDYLDRIGFEHRDPEASRRGSDDGHAYMSKRQRDHLWYGDHSELNWRDREQAQAWGMDADTYVSNWLEHDPD
jgi:hypothetical protein